MLNEPVDITKKYRTDCGYPVVLEAISGDPGYSHPVDGRVIGMFAKTVGQLDEIVSRGCWTEFGSWRGDNEPNLMDLVEIKNE